MSVKEMDDMVEDVFIYILMRLPVHILSTLIVVGWFGGEWVKDIV